MYSIIPTDNYPILDDITTIRNLSCSDTRVPLRIAKSDKLHGTYIQGLKHMVTRTKPALARNLKPRITSSHRAMVG